MSNQVYLDFEKVHALDEQGNVRKEYLTYILYDGYGEKTGRDYASIQELAKEINPDTVYSFICKNHFDFAEEVRNKGICLNGKWLNASDLHIPAEDYLDPSDTEEEEEE